MALIMCGKLMEESSIKIAPLQKQLFHGYVAKRIVYGKIKHFIFRIILGFVKLLVKSNEFLI